MSELPDGWAETTLGELADFEMGQAPPGSASNFIGVGTPFVKAGEFGARRPIIREWTTSPLKFAKESDVLICVVGATAGKLNLGADCAIGRSVAAIRPFSGVLQSLLYFQLLPRVLSLRAASTGSAQGVISKAQLAALSFTLPPLPDQKRIADKLEAVLGRVDACRARLARVPDLLKRFRQSVLAAATSGRLTEDWRRKTNAPLREKTIPIGEGTIEIPEYWEIGQLRDIIDPKRPLCYGVVQPGEERSGGVPLIRVQDMLGGQISVNDLRTVSTSIDAEYKRSRVKEGDLLLSVVGTIGRTSIVPSNLEANIARAIARIACKDGVDSRWINYWLCFEPMQWWLTSSSKEVARKTLNLSDVSSAPVAIPPEAEQQEIVRRIESLFAIADRIESCLNDSQVTVDRLIPSTLAKAFRGELVPQDPNDEPASALLARIRADRAAAPKTKRRIKRTSSSSPRAQKEKAAMSKSRFDDDVKGKPFLTSLLKNANAPLFAEELLSKSELPLVDFYKQLAWEVDQGWIEDKNSSLEVVA